MATFVAPVSSKNHSSRFPNEVPSVPNNIRLTTQADLFAKDTYRTVDKTEPPPGYACQVNLFGGKCDWIQLSNGQVVPVFKPGNQLKFNNRAIEMDYAASFAVRGKEGIGSATAVYAERTERGTYLNLILTNRHVVQNQDGSIDKNPMLTSLWTGQAHQGTVLKVSDNIDAAMVVVETSQPFATIPLAITHTMENGEVKPTTPIGLSAVAIGTTLGAFPGSVTYGNISHSFRTLEPDSGWYLQFTSPISPGNSGGGLFREDGALLGIVTATIPSTPDTPSQNINFAVPADFALRDMGFDFILEQPVS